MTTFAATTLLADVHRRMMLHRIRHGLSANRLLVLTIGGFLGLYCVAAYVLVARGLDFISKMPLFGPLLTERLVFVLFFFFFVMLVISNATITGIGLFRRKDMDWQVALPLPYRSLVLWKTLEGMALASWGLLVLSAPILIALGRVYEKQSQTSIGFYLAGVPALLCLVTISANVSTWALLLLVRYARPWWGRVAIAAGVGVLGLAFYRFWTTTPENIQAGDLISNLHEVLKHTQLCMHPMLPSSWVAETLFAAGRGVYHQALFYNLALLANALFVLAVTAKLGGHLFYPAWHRVMAAVPEQQANALATAWYRQPVKFPPRDLLRRILGLDRPGAAMLGKDLRTFLREPVQWGQCSLVFGLLLMYTSNLRRLGYDLQNPFWTLVISHLNLLVCNLALSTLTTRFVFPQFSMEGQRLWILGLSPVALERMLGLKLRLTAGTLALLTGLLVLVSSLSLGLPQNRILFFLAAVMMMSFGLTSLALSLGTILPNFRETNPARVISGFGGTLCLICSFLYILGCSAALALPDAVAWQQKLMKIPLTAEEIMRRELSALGAVGFLTLVFGSVPWWWAKKRTKNLDYLKDL